MILASSTVVTILVVCGLLLIIAISINSLLKYYHKVIGYTFFIASLIAALSVLYSIISKSVFVVNNFGSHKEFYAIGNSFNYTYKNGITKKIKVEYRTLINNTDENLIYDHIKYGGGLNEQNERVVIKAYTSQAIGDIDYWFIVPPEKIKSSSSIEVKGYIHREHDPNENIYKSKSDSLIKELRKKLEETIKKE
jgi:hypothetical protein